MFFNDCRKIASVACLVLTLAACTDPHVTVDNDTHMAEFVIPTDLPFLRMVNPANVTVTVSLNFQPVDMSPITGNRDRWSGSLDVARNQQYRIDVQWVEQYQNSQLILGKAIDFVSVTGADPVNVVFDASNIDTSWDSDGDQWFNVVERTIGTEPRESSDPESSPPLTTLTVQFRVPDQLAGLSPADQAQTDVSLSVNGNGISAVVTNGLYQGAVDVPVDAPAFVTVTWFVNSDREQRLARVAKNFTVAADATLELISSEFRVDYDADADGVSNLQELLTANSAPHF